MFSYFRDYASLELLNAFVYLTYLTVELMIYETCLKVSPMGRIAAMAVLVQYMNLLHKFSLFDRKQKMFISVVTWIYFCARFYFHFKDDPNNQFHEDVPPIIMAFLAV